MKLNAFTWIIVTLAVTAWVFILPLEAVARLGIYPAAGGGGDDFSIAACAAFVYQAQ